MLHLHSIIAAFNRTNYLQWCLLYVEDMQQLQHKAPDVYAEFLAGNFSVKRTPGKCNPVEADMCLEQTINRSQKNNAGIIGVSKKKDVVAQWELI